MRILNNTVIWLALGNLCISAVFVFRAGMKLMNKKSLVDKILEELHINNEKCPKCGSGEENIVIDQLFMQLNNSIFTANHCKVCNKLWRNT
jgi:DNA-directed RNA polymerase subunit M/transcription elongation factor TFIIS